MKFTVVGAKLSQLSRAIALAGFNPFLGLQVSCHDLTSNPLIDVVCTIVVQELLKC
ncbi:hypothetical protein H6F50_18805 [Coleofasciculus sp. FACHB-712]|uniref:hypothetical protein n=1 Tax=Coleofasciculus sp. FACHB-712 TaxID=2692789 RepID=UPI00168302A5|nr:hypothetical protein [Coleofasciculus sp. FACHB-712]MBD1944379.1 hypothetical protein [Coleofasciculus sp. FACHB-712]